MRHFLIDGNNLLGKLSVKDKSFRAENAGSRELLLLHLLEHFNTRNDTVTLYFDGYESGNLKSGKIKVVYSNNRAADVLIRERIEKTKNRTTLVVVSSDNEIKNFAKVCSAETILSENFATRIFSGRSGKSENGEKKDPSADKDYFLKLFSNSQNPSDD